MTRMASSGKRLAKIIKNQGFVMGKAQKFWNTKLNEEEKRALLDRWCKATTQQARIAVTLPWHALSHWMRISIKRYVRQYSKDKGPFHPVPKKEEK